MSLSDIWHFVSRYIDGFAAAVALAVPTTIIATVHLYARLTQQRGIVRADLLLKISKEASIKEFTDIFEDLEKFRRNWKFVPDEYFIEEEKQLKADAKFSGRMVLRFFETLVLMLESHILSDSEIVSLLGYRINLMLNTKAVQEKYLISEFTDRSGNIGWRANHSFCAVYALNERMRRYIRRNFRSFTEKKGYLRDVNFISSWRLSRYSFYKGALAQYEKRVAANRPLYWRVWNSIKRGFKAAIRIARLRLNRIKEFVKFVFRWQVDRATSALVFLKRQVERADALDGLVVRVARKKLSMLVLHIRTARQFLASLPSKILTYLRKIARLP